MCVCIHAEDVPDGMVTILEGHSISHSKQNYVCTCVLFRTVSEISLYSSKFFIRKRYDMFFMVCILLCTILSRVFVTIDTVWIGG
jgi:hypothetical protein